MPRRMIIERKQANKLEPFSINIGFELPLAVKKSFSERKATSEKKKKQTHAQAISCIIGSDISKLTGKYVEIYER